MFFPLFISPIPTPTATQSPDKVDNWKTYRNEKHRFDFQYPNDWNITERMSETIWDKTEIDLISPDKNQNIIHFSIALVISGGYREIECPILTHVVECKNLQNSNGVKYAREISTGQLKYDSQQQLDVFLATSNSDIQMTLPLTETNGKSLPFIAATTLIFDKILNTIKIN